MSQPSSPQLVVDSTGAPTESREEVDGGPREQPIRRRVLVFAGTFPSAVQPTHGVFVKERVRFVSQLPGYDVRVISPSPYFPPIKAFGRWYPWSQIPAVENVAGLEVTRPKYPLVPKIGGYIHPRLMQPAVSAGCRRIRKSFDFDLVDAHFVYPAGVAAARVARKFNKPLVITGRGEDILRFPKLANIGKQIRWALQQADQLVALSEEIAEAMEQNGAHPDKIHVIPNGVDCEKFHPFPRDEARRNLDLPQDRPIVVSAGYRIERKGFHLLVDAIPKLRERFPNVLVIIVGGEARWENDFLPEIQRRVDEHGVQDHVQFTGNLPQTELKRWYSAADVFGLLTSREGCPNVVMEAAACGAPIAATPVGGIPEILADDKLGLLLTERSAEAAAVGIEAALAKSWDRDYIRQWALANGWRETAEKVHAVFDKAIQGD